MRLKALTLQNFATFGDSSSRIEFAPLTMLFGPNSSGKTSVLKAMHYLRSVLVHRELDPQFVLDGCVDLGGFTRLVHRHDRRRTVTLGVEVLVGDDFTNDVAVDRADLSIELASRPYLDRPCLDIVAVQMELRWSEVEERPFVSAFETFVDGQALARVRCSADFKRVEFESFAMGHPTIVWPVDDSTTQADFCLAAEHRLGMWGSRNGPGADAELIRLPDWSCAVRTPTAAGALPPDEWSAFVPLIDRNVEVAASGEIEAVVDEGLRLLLRECVMAPFAAARRAIETFVHLGPLRGVPKRYEVHRNKSALSAWWDGAAAWAAMAAASEEQLTSLNSALGSDRLDTGLSVHVSRVRLVPTTGVVALAIRGGSLLDQVDEIRAEFEALPVQVRVLLVDELSGIVVEPGEVGVGMAQMLPILVLATLTRIDFAVVEQPELHIHPAQQVELAEILASAATGIGERVFFLETHSEHMVLRLLRLIRKASEGDTPPGSLRLEPDDLAVHCIERGSDGARIWRLRVDKDGDFIDPWPRGFFEERARELFE